MYSEKTMKQKNNDVINCVLVIGLGRIGLPQALNLAYAGIRVYGFDKSFAVVEDLNNYKTPFYEPSMDQYLKTTINKNFLPCSSWDEIEKHLTEIDAIIFTIGTSAPSRTRCFK
jgi:UDP-N-acetyl-D-mannosaminuronate dehydrogenase